MEYMNIYRQRKSSLFMPKAQNIPHSQIALNIRISRRFKKYQHIVD